MIVERAYAKINLSLDVIKKRSDGYHDLRSIMSPVSLYDELYFYPNEEVVLESEVSIDNNIILKAAHLLKEKYNVDMGARIKLIKRIPVAAGLAGGSADASATLRGLNKLWNLGLSLDELAQLSALLGSDTIFCIYNKLAYIEGRGERVNFIANDIDAYVLLIKPYYGVSTKEVFANHVCNYQGEERFNKLITEINNNSFPLSIYNDLEETTLKICPELQLLVDEIKKFDPSVKMSGSGPTLYIISNDKIHLNKIYRQFISQNIVHLLKLGIFM